MVFNKYLRIIVFSTAILLTLNNAPVFSVSADTVSTRLDALYKNFEYDSLEIYALKTLNTSDSLDVSTMANLYKYLGLIYIIGGRETLGKRYFGEWLKTDHSGYIDSFNYPPEIVRVFMEVKADMEKSEVKQVLLPPERRLIGFTDAAKSLTVPGWGQIIKGERTKGLLLFGGQSIALTMLIVSSHNFTLSEHAYHMETNPDNFDKLYNRASNWNYALWASALTSTGIYIFTQTDFFLVPPIKNGTSKMSIGIFPSQTSHSSSSSCSSVPIVAITFSK